MCGQKLGFASLLTSWLVISDLMFRGLRVSPGSRVTLLCHALAEHRDLKRKNAYDHAHIVLRKSTGVTMTDQASNGWDWTYDLGRG